MLEKIIEMYKDACCFQEAEEGEYKSFNIAGMDFVTEGYTVPGVGHASVMNAQGMGGMMKMSSFIVNPFEVDMPLYSVDRIQVAGNDMLYMELYDTCIDPVRKEEAFARICEKYKDLPDIPQQPNWYDDIRYTSCIVKKVPADQSAAVDACIEEYASEYLRQLKNAEPCDIAQKKEKAKAYTDGLLNHGGPATDTFLKIWGTEKTRELFEQVLFG